MDRTTEFDRIAPVYDETRRPPSDGELDALQELFEGCRTVADAGIGTGRFAAPLVKRGFEVVGVDLSVHMMHRARAKGIEFLIRADVRHLPLKPASVDASFMAHVLQLVPDPKEVLRELGRVSRRSVVVLVPDWAEHQSGGEWRQLREQYRAIAAELGYPLPPRPPRFQHTLEELSAIARPQEVRLVSSPPILPEGRQDRLGRWMALSFGPTPIPPDVHAEIVRRMQGQRSAEQIRSPRVRQERFIRWDPASLRRSGD